tara:strand:+ start:997 stop:1155 length:159 start_codon:yes stop_codon:yes gene_type:complete
MFTKIIQLVIKMINKNSKEVDKLQPIYYNMFVGAYVEAYIKTSCLMKGDSND